MKESITTVPPGKEVPTVYRSSNEQREKKSQDKIVRQGFGYTPAGLSLVVLNDLISGRGSSRLRCAPQRAGLADTALSYE